MYDIAERDQPMTSPLAGGCLCGAVRYADKADSGRTLYRHFCGDCGSPLYAHRETSPERVVVRMGSFDDPPAAKITVNIWTKSARPWSWIDPATECHPANPPG
jgi:hypothetical protein